MASKIGEIIKSVRVERAMTQHEFSKSLGIAQGYLSDIEHGKKLPSDTLLIALAHLYDVPREVIQPLATLPPLPPGKSELPLLRSISRLPEGASPPGEVIDTIRLPGVRSGCYAVAAAGNFMAPTIWDGDIVVFSICDEVEHGDIVFLTNRWGEAILRRFRLKDNEVFFAADNNAYAPFRPDSDTRVIGKVEAVWRNVPFKV